MNPLDSTIEHLGDGLYVAWNGWAIEIRVNSHRNAPVAFMEPQALAAFDRWRAQHQSLLLP